LGISLRRLVIGRTHLGPRKPPECFCRRATAQCSSPSKVLPCFRILTLLEDRLSQRDLLLILRLNASLDCAQAGKHPIRSSRTLKKKNASHRFRPGIPCCQRSRPRRSVCATWLSLLATSEIAPRLKRSLPSKASRFKHFLCNTSISGNPSALKPHIRTLSLACSTRVALRNLRHSALGIGQ
jgi:hypothetical protein